MPKHSKKPKTEDLEWLIHSINAFNGSGYADMNSAEDFLDSYIMYKAWSKKPEAVMLAQRHRENVLLTIEGLIERSYGAGRKPSVNALKSFQAFKDNAGKQTSLTDRS